MTPTLDDVQYVIRSRSVKKAHQFFCVIKISRFGDFYEYISRDGKVT